VIKVAVKYIITIIIDAMAKIEVPMPKMGESITEGSVIVWHKKEGDSVELDETLLEIGTDKVDTDVPSPVSGVIAKILTPEGETVPVGHIIALIQPNGESSKEDSQPSLTSEVAPSALDTQMKDMPVVMPKMGESITEGTVITWHKQIGDLVELDETLLEIGTDKVDTDVPAPVTGILKKILVPEGETVDVGSTIAMIGAEIAPSNSDDIVHSEIQPDRSDVTESESSKEAKLQPSEKSERHSGNGRFLSPLVRSMVQAENISQEELTRIDGSGRNGRITKKDVVNHLESRDVIAPQSTSNASAALHRESSSDVGMAISVNGDERIEVVKMDRMRQLIAEHMTLSRRTAAHVTSFAEVDVTQLVQIREANKKAFLERDGINLTYAPFFIYAAVEALRDFPMLNSSVDGDKILLRKDYHIGMAVAIKSGLIVPVIRHAGRLSITGLAHASNDLAHRARATELLPDDLQGGTFTLTNVGSLGSMMGTPIILQPQVAILATGTIKKRPVVIEHPIHGDSIGIRHMMILSLSYDHRIIDGAMGIAFLRRYTEVIESLDPNLEL